MPREPNDSHQLRWTGQPFGLNSNAARVNWRIIAKRIIVEGRKKQPKRNIIILVHNVLFIMYSASFFS